MLLGLMLLAPGVAPAQSEAEAPAGEPAQAPAAVPAPITAETARLEPAADGPSVELITGGASSDGAAHVGRMPVLD